MSELSSHVGGSPSQPAGVFSATGTGFAVSHHADGAYRDRNHQVRAGNLDESYRGPLRISPDTACAPACPQSEDTRLPSPNDDCPSQPANAYRDRDHHVEKGGRDESDKRQQRVAGRISEHVFLDTLEQYHGGLHLSLRRVMHARQLNRELLDDDGSHDIATLDTDRSDGLLDVPQFGGDGPQSLLTKKIRGRTTGGNADISDGAVLTVSAIGDMCVQNNFETATKMPPRKTWSGASTAPGAPGPDTGFRA